MEGIGVSAFEGAKIAVSDISLPTTLTKIHDSAFNGTTGISSFTLPEKVDYIGNSAFAGSSIAKINLSAAPGIECFKYAKNLSSVTFAEKVDTIATEAFYGCVKLANITLPQSLTEIGSTAFYGCTGLTKIAFNAGLAEIGTSAFSGCTGLTEINLPESLQNIGNYAFKNCSSLTKAYVTASVPEECFYSDSKLAEVVMTDDVYSIGDNAFQNCTGLTSVTIGNSVESIGTLAFSGCSGLTELTLGNSLASIGTAAFYQCSGLTSTLTIPQSVTNIGYGAFWQTNYQKVEYNAENCSVVTADASMGTGISSPFPTTMEGLIIGNSVNIIPESAFLGRNKLTSVTFGSSVDSIGADAFNGCNLTELVLSPATKSIGEKAFAGNNLKNIALGCNVTKIDAKAFDGANSLKGVSITALTPPAAENTTFSYYDCPLYVSPSENDVVKDAYYNFTRCWYRFSGYDLIPIKEVTVTGNSSINLKPGESVKLTATFTPADASLPYIFWRSTNPAIATVDKDGNVTMVAKDSDVETYSDEAASCQIIAETLYADGPVASVTIVEASSGIDDVVIDEPAVAPTRPNDIYNLQGICLKRNATDDDVKALAPGLYIVSGKKILVK